MTKYSILDKLDRIQLHLTKQRAEVGAQYDRTLNANLMHEWMSIHEGVMDVENARRRVERGAA